MAILIIFGLMVLFGSVNQWYFTVKSAHPGYVLFRDVYFYKYYSRRYNSKPTQYEINHYSDISRPTH